MTKPLILLAVATTSAMLTLVFCMFAPRLCRILGLLDIPGGRKQHARPTPLVGGAAILLAIMPTLLVLYVIRPDLMPPTLATIGPLTTVLALLGLADDRAHISAILRLIAMAVILVAAYLVGDAPSLDVLSASFSRTEIRLPTFVSQLFTVLCMLTLINALNLADGKNGLLIGILVAVLSLLLVSSPPGYTFVITAFLGSLLVLMLFNLPGRVFLGDGGSYGFGAAVGYLAIAINGQSSILATSDQIGLLFIIPIIDMARLVVQRKHAGQAAFAADRQHLHHYLLDWLGWPRGLAIYLALVFVPVALSLMFPYWTVLMIVASLCGYILIVSHGIQRTRSPSLNEN